MGTSDVEGSVLFCTFFLESRGLLPPKQGAVYVPSEIGSAIEVLVQTDLTQVLFDHIFPIRALEPVTVGVHHAILSFVGTLFPTPIGGCSTPPVRPVKDNKEGRELHVGSELLDHDREVLFTTRPWGRTMTSRAQTRRDCRDAGSPIGSPPPRPPRR